MSKPLYAPILTAADKWLKELEGLSAFIILDLLFLEQDSGCRAGANMYPYDSLALTPVHIFTHREIIESMIMLPEEYKRSNKLWFDISQVAWPEITRYPINEYIGIKNFPHKIIKQIKLALKPFVYKYHQSYFERKNL